MSKGKEVFLNEDIRAAELRCIGDDGKAYGILPREKALEVAYQSGLDLVLIAPNAKPPVAKIMDYKKFCYQQEKKLKEAKKKQKVIEIKEIKFSAKIAQNDVNYKIKHAKEFLDDDKHVKLRVFLKGREIATPEIGVNLLNKIWDEYFEGNAIKEKEPIIEGRYVSMLVTPKKV